MFNSVLFLFQEDVDRSMKRLLKIAEFRDPTPNDVSTSTALANITKEHLENFFVIFRNLAERPLRDATMSDEADILNDPSAPSDNRAMEEAFLPSSDSECSSDPENQEVDEVLPSPLGSDVSSDILDEISSETEEEQFEVERIISRTVNAEGKYVYHIKWVGYETSSDPENFVDEDDMHCPELIEKFERMERLKKKQRAKKLEEQAMLARKRKIAAEQRAREAFAATSRRSSTDEEARKKSCKEINLCSSTSASEEEDNENRSKLPCVKRRAGSSSDHNRPSSRTTDRSSKKKKIKHKASVKLQKRIESLSSSSEDEEELKPAKRRSATGSPDNIADENCSDTNECEGNTDPDAGFKYVMRETDGFQRGYKELRQYFLAAKTQGNADSKNLALSLLLQSSSKPA
ncbi:chromo' (CHRromatin Organization MOdifier) domain protein [Cooperia oncophora]